eukprot:7332700-Pyramimonas_sp.AAC.1
MSHPVSSTTEHSQHETLIPLASYPDSQRKYWLSAEAIQELVFGGAAFSPSVREIPACLRVLQRDSGMPAVKSAPPS